MTTPTSALLQITSHLKDALNGLRDRQEFVVARDFCAQVRETFYAIYAEYHFDRASVTGEILREACESAAEEKRILQSLKLANTAEGDLVTMYAESVGFRC